MPNLARSEESQLRQHLRGVLRHWVALVTGSIPAAVYPFLVVGLPDTEHWWYLWNHIPKWAVLTLFFLGIIVAQYRAWRDTQVKLRRAETHIAEIVNNAEEDARDFLAKSSTASPLARIEELRRRAREISLSGEPGSRVRLLNFSEYLLKEARRVVMTAEFDVIKAEVQSWFDRKEN